MAEDKKEKAEKPKKEAKPKAGKSKKGKGPGGKQKASIRLAQAGETKISPAEKPRLQKVYEDQVIKKLQDQFKYRTPMQVPRLNKIVINCAVKEAVGNPKILDNTLVEIMAITGQKAVLTRSRKSIANFKLREGIPLGVRVTLRRARMYEFLDRMINVALPRVRDFRGISPKSFDGRGNYSLGLKEQIIFPEVNFDTVEQISGMTITVQTSAKTNDEARTLLTELGMPFRK